MAAYMEGLTQRRTRLSLQCRYPAVREGFLTPSHGIRPLGGYSPPTPLSRRNISIADSLHSNLTLPQIHHCQHHYHRYQLEGPHHHHHHHHHHNELQGAQRAGGRHFSATPNRSLYKRERLRSPSPSCAQGLQFCFLGH